MISDERNGMWTLAVLMVSLELSSGASVGMNREAGEAENCGPRTTHTASAALAVWKPTVRPHSARITAEHKARYTPSQTEDAWAIACISIIATSLDLLWRCRRCTTTAAGKVRQKTASCNVA